MVTPRTAPQTPRPSQITQAICDGLIVEVANVGDVREREPWIVARIRCHESGLIVAVVAPHSPSSRGATWQVARVFVQVGDQVRLGRALAELGEVQEGRRIARFANFVRAVLRR